MLSNDNDTLHSSAPGPRPPETVYFRRLFRRGGSLCVALPSAFRQRWGAARYDVVRVALRDDGTLTISPIQGEHRAG